MASRVSALMVLRWFIDETGIPVEVRSANWDFNLRELFKGHISNLDIDARYLPLNTDARLRTEVDYVRRSGKWKIRLKPTLWIAKLPPLTGAIDLELDVKRRKAKAETEGAAIEFRLKETEALSFATSLGKIDVPSFKLKGHLLWNPLADTPEKRWSSQIDFTAEEVALAQTARTVKIKAVHLESDLHWPDKPPFPVRVEAKTALADLQAAEGNVFILEPAIFLKTDFVFDGKSFPQVDIVVDNSGDPKNKNPDFRLSAQGAIQEGFESSRGKFRLDANLEKIYEDRFVAWFESGAPVIRRSKAKGRLTAAGNFGLNVKSGFSIRSDVDLKADSFKLPARGLEAKDVRIKMPLGFPEMTDWGRVFVGQATYHSINLYGLLIDARLSNEGLDFTTEDDDGNDRPIRQNLWGGTIDVRDLYMHIGGAEGFQFTAKVIGGPFALSDVQRDLCLAPTKPMKGSLSFTYPQIVQDKDSLRLIGDTNIVVFNGTAHVGDMSLEIPTGSERFPRLTFNLDWNDLDMHAIGEWSGFGDMRGSLDGYLKEATLQLTPYGPIPMKYDFEIKGRERSGKKMSFYGRAIDNIMEMLAGNSVKESIGIGNFALRLVKLWRNWMPATAHYLGFHAKNDGEWTEMTTFDPPWDPSGHNPPCDIQKNHYILCGSAFTIPVNSHGVYPVLLRTEAFHTWLLEMVNRLKRSLGHEKKIDDPNECKPPWE